MLSAPILHKENTPFELSKINEDNASEFNQSLHILPNRTISFKSISSEPTVSRINSLESVNSTLRFSDRFLSIFLDFNDSEDTVEVEIGSYDDDVEELIGTMRMNFPPYLCCWLTS